MTPTCILLEITTHCDRRCPDCCAGVGINRKLVHHDLAYFGRAATFLYGVERVHLTGGEPTMHPQLSVYLPLFKVIFGCQRLTMITNGFGVERYEALIRRHIDEIHFSDYGDRPAARRIIESMPHHSIYEAGEGAAMHWPRATAKGTACERAHSESVPYADGKLWGCAGAPGMAGAVGIVPGPDWRERVQELSLPCAGCAFAL